MSHDPHTAAVKTLPSFLMHVKAIIKNKLVVPTDGDILPKEEMVHMWKCRKYQ